MRERILAILRRTTALSTAAGRRGPFRVGAAVACAMLIGACADVTPAALPTGTPPLHVAAAQGELDAVERLASRGGVDRRGPHGWTALHVAAIFGRTAVARLLLDRRAHADALDATGMTPLHWAARRGHDAIVSLLLDRKADVMARNKLDMTPLHEARTERVAQLLLAAGASLQARDIDGMTPLHVAASREVALFLIQRGADVRARAKDGRTPLDMPPAVRGRAAAR